MAATGPVYVYRCPVCGKKFEHKTQTPAIRRYGIFERVK
jgi:hypothetical protein